MNLPQHENKEPDKMPFIKWLRNIFLLGLVAGGSILFWFYFIKLLIWIL